MIKIIVLILTILYGFKCNSQEEDGIIDNSWNEYLHCLNVNTIELLNNQDLLNLEIKNYDKLNMIQLLKMIGDGYTDETIAMIKISIDKAYKKLPIVLKNVNQKWEISSHLEHLFFIYFDEEYVKFHKLKPCRKIDNINDYADYELVLESTKKIIMNYYKESHFKCHSNVNKLQYPINDYFFKIAVQNHKPELKEYVTLKVLNEKNFKRMNDKEKYDDLIYLWDL